MSGPRDSCDQPDGMNALHRGRTSRASLQVAVKQMDIFVEGLLRVGTHGSCVRFRICIRPMADVRVGRYRKPL